MRERMKQKIKRPSDPNFNMSKTLIIRNIVGNTMRSPKIILSKKTVPGLKYGLKMVYIERIFGKEPNKITFRDKCMVVPVNNCLPGESEYLYIPVDADAKYIYVPIKDKPGMFTKKWQLMYPVVNVKVD